MEQPKVKISGRYFREKIEDLFLRIHRAGKRTMKKTDSERAVGLIQNSLDRDFVEGFRKRDHGFDAFQITSGFQTRLAAQIESEQREQELAYLTEVIEVLRETQAEAEIRKAEIDSGRGSLVLFNRQRELAEAHKNAQKRIGMAG